MAFILEIDGHRGSVFLPKTSCDHAAYLIALISDHHLEFCELYPGRVLFPKCTL